MLFLIKLRRPQFFFPGKKSFFYRMIFEDFQNNSKFIFQKNQKKYFLFEDFQNNSK